MAAESLNTPICEVSVCCPEAMKRIIRIDRADPHSQAVEAGNYLVITDFQVEETTNRVTCPVKTTRLYTLRHVAALSTGIQGFP